MTTPAPAAAAATPCAAETCPAARIGAVVFKNRGWLPVPFLVVPLLAPGASSPWFWGIGLALMALGEGWRLWGVATAGTVTRRRSRTVHHLVRHGPFAWSRNPLYVGNFLIWMGVIVISGVLWFLPVALLIFAIEYYFIVRYEEGVLETIFGEEYLRYKGEIGRWIPFPPSEKAPGEYRWGESWKSEISTFMQYAALLVLFTAKMKYFPNGIR